VQNTARKKEKLKFRKLFFQNPNTYGVFLRRRLPSHDQGGLDFLLDSSKTFILFYFRTKLSLNKFMKIIFRQLSKN
jgi:hypothetical protein